MIKGRGGFVERREQNFGIISTFALALGEFEGRETYSQDIDDGRITVGSNNDAGQLEALRISVHVHLCRSFACRIRIRLRQNTVLKQIWIPVLSLAVDPVGGHVNELLHTAFDSSFQDDVSTMDICLGESE
jgi:hypothetical protein